MHQRAFLMSRVYREPASSGTKPAGGGTEAFFCSLSESQAISKQKGRECGIFCYLKGSLTKPGYVLLNEVHCDRQIHYTNDKHRTIPAPSREKTLKKDRTCSGFIAFRMIGRTRPIQPIRKGLLPIRCQTIAPVIWRGFSDVGLVTCFTHLIPVTFFWSYTSIFS